MKQSVSVVVAGIISTSSAIQNKASPDVFGANGRDYLNVDPRVDLARIGISFSEKGKGKHCKLGDWTTVHWVGYLKDGREVTNSRSEGLGYPKTFSLGTNDVFKCWELAITKMKQGSKARVSCPYDLAWGNAFTWAPLGGEPIPLHSDVDFDLEIVECNRTPVWTKQVKQPRTTTLQPGKCFYLHNRESDHESTPLVLDCAGDDKDCFLEEWVHDEPQQSWVYDLESGQITDWYTRSLYLQVGPKRSIVVSKSKSPHKWFFEDSSQTLEFVKHGLPYELTTPQVRKWSPVTVTPHRLQTVRDDTLSKWRIEYCWENK